MKTSIRPGRPVLLAVLALATPALTAFPLAALPLAAGFDARAAEPSAQPAQAASPVEIRDGLVFVQASIGDAGPALFLFDTGAGASVVDPAYARRAGLAAAGSIGVNTGDRREDRADQAAPADLTLGGVRARVEPVILSLDAIGRQLGRPLAGVVGADFMQGFTVTIDYPRGRLTLTRGGRLSPRDPGVVPVRIAPHPFVEAEARLGERRLFGEFQIDTGSDTAVEIHRPRADEAFGRAAGRPSLGMTVAGVHPQRLGRLDDLTVGAVRLGTLSANFAAETRPNGAGAGYAGLIGGPAFRGQVLTIDFPDGLMRLRPAAVATATD